MKLSLVELYSPGAGDFVLYEAVVDTGADLCVIPEHIRLREGLPLNGNIEHIWQMRDPITYQSTRIIVRLSGNSFDNVEAAVIEIPEAFLGPAHPHEYCTRPDAPHMLANRIVLGENLLRMLSEEQKTQL